MKNKEKEYGTYLKDISLNEEEEISKKEHRKEDHYHGIHHFDSKGGHDHIEKDEFKLSIEFRMSRRRLIYKMVLTSVFLALTATVSALDILFEKIALPVGSGQLWIDFRFLDIAFICISIATLGPIFSSIIGLLNPFIHFAMHGGDHGIWSTVIEAPQNVLIVWMVWLVFNVLFNNSPIHRETDKIKSRFKRFAPIPLMIIFASIITTGMFILGMYLDGLTTNSHHVHEHSISLFHEGHDHSDGKLENVADINFVIGISIFAWNILRYSVAFSIFSIVEWRMRPINHRYK
ncbi:ECF transporter S component [Mesoplasma florum]|uniref:ECF transporter S component n=1 Tax=Mesoplasma florum TaxID=2151 RepID=UPI000BE3A9E2|nr:ECF transporter S component [Mesoplasma florum]ATI73508.1 ECF transporter S component [Mesoplasma florum]ATI74195.1 ECF transporter S component [Mesoplasma florum]AVN61901.1 ECF transporter S component [Mesoplasma florum]